jgi:ethanolamine permease
MVSFIILRLKMPSIDRPYRSPFGIMGAVVAMAIALVALVTLFVMNPEYRNVSIGAALWFGLGIGYFALIGRHRLVRSPEEEFALTERSPREAAV